MKRFSLLFLLLWFIPAHAQTISGRVVSITDGDTIKILDATNTPHRIRLHGIDCPEKKQPFGSRAKLHASDLVFNQIVTVNVVDVDRYKRQVGEVTLPDGRNLAHELLHAGYGWWYRKYAPNDEVLAGIEREARLARRPHEPAAQYPLADQEPAGEDRARPDQPCPGGGRYSYP